MVASNQILKSIPTNIITGFLGAGKTSAILHLLKSKPNDERWAILVNEFGEIGVDGSLFEGQFSQDNGVFVKEVPGGCMCCTTGLSMQIALNDLLKQSRPHRLFIEPTGLGHPIEIMDVLNTEYYQALLTLKNVLTLVDARKLADERYTSNTIFNQQFQIADIIIGNKKDLYSPDDIERLKKFASTHGKNPGQIVLAEHAAIDSRWLDKISLAEPSSLEAKCDCSHDDHTPDNHIHDHQSHNHAHHHPSAIDKNFDGTEHIQVRGKGEGFETIGWRFSSGNVFDQYKLKVFLASLDVERVKASFITNRGYFGYNLTADHLTQYHLKQCQESRIEIIALHIEEDWHDQLLSCLVS